MKVLLGLLASGPLFYLLIKIFFDQLGPDPAKSMMLLTGQWAFNFLLIALLISSASRMSSRFRGLLFFRRMVGLWAFFYSSLHLLIFIGLYLGFDWPELFMQLQKHPYISVGFGAWALMIPMTLTSNRRALNYLGAARWKSLHKGVYLTLLLCLIHVFWQIRAEWGGAFFYGLAGSLLLVERMAGRQLFFLRGPCKKRASSPQKS